jgi:hypothetical protein
VSCWKPGHALPPALYTATPLFHAPALLQDPTWVLESQCVQQLCRDGSQAPAALLSGKSLPPFLFKDKRERDEAAFARFLRERPHLFAAGDGAGGERVKAVPGE